MPRQRGQSQRPHWPFLVPFCPVSARGQVQPVTTKPSADGQAWLLPSIAWLRVGCVVTPTRAEPRKEVPRTVPLQKAAVPSTTHGESQGLEEPQRGGPPPGSLRLRPPTPLLEGDGPR